MASKILKQQSKKSLLVGSVFRFLLFFIFLFLPSRSQNLSRGDASQNRNVYHIWQLGSKIQIMQSISWWSIVLRRADWTDHVPNTVQIQGGGQKLIHQSKKKKKPEEIQIHTTTKNEFNKHTFTSKHHIMYPDSKYKKKNPWIC